MKRILPSVLIFALIPSVLRAEPTKTSTNGAAVLRIEIVRVAANRNLFPLAFPTPSRVNGIMDELAVVERNAATDHIKFTITRFPAVTVQSGSTATVITGREPSGRSAGGRRRLPVYHRIVVTPRDNRDGSLGVSCRVTDTWPDPDFRSAIGEPPTYTNAGTSVLRLQSGDSQLIEAAGGGPRPFFIYYAIVTALPRMMDRSVPPGKRDALPNKVRAGRPLRDVDAGVGSGA